MQEAHACHSVRRLFPLAAEKRTRLPRGLVHYCANAISTVPGKHVGETTQEERCVCSACVHVNHQKRLNY